MRQPLNMLLMCSVLVWVGCTKTVILKEDEPLRLSASPPEPPPPEPPPPPEEPKRVEVQEERIQVNETIHFDLNKATIRPESHDLLAEIAQVINDHPEIKKIRIEGHTDNTGSRSYNLDLSKRRAASVRKHLTDKGGVDGSRLETEGYGFDQPIADNETEEGRGKNRRVEFEILERSKDSGAAASGDAGKKAGEAGKKAGDAPSEGSKEESAPAKTEKEGA